MTHWSAGDSSIQYDRRSSSCEAVTQFPQGRELVSTPHHFPFFPFCFFLAHVLVFFRQIGSNYFQPTSFQNLVHTCCLLLLVCKHPVTLHPCSATYTTGARRSTWTSFYLPSWSTWTSRWKHKMTFEGLASQQHGCQKQQSHGPLPVTTCCQILSALLSMEGSSLFQILSSHCCLCQTSQEALLHGETLNKHLVPLPDLMEIALPN